MRARNNSLPRDRSSRHWPYNGMLSGYNFTNDVRHVLALARIESHRLRHEYVGTEHLLLAYTNGEVRAAVRLLGALSIDHDKLRAEIEQRVQSGTSPRNSAHQLPYTSRAKKCLENAMTVARQSGQNFVGIEHLLAGIIREEKGIAAQVLAMQGASERAVIAVVAGLPLPTAQPERRRRMVLARLWAWLRGKK